MTSSFFTVFNQVSRMPTARSSKKHVLNGASIIVVFQFSTAAPGRSPRQIANGRRRPKTMPIGELLERRCFQRPAPMQILTVDSVGHEQNVDPPADSAGD